jgi:hypothetical protein
MTTFRISDPDLVPDLLEHLGARRDVVAARIDRDTIRVNLIGSYSRDAMNLTADLMVRAWEAAQRAEGVDVRVELES